MVAVFEPLYNNGCIADTLDSDVLVRTYKVLQSARSTSTKDELTCVTFHFNFCQTQIYRIKIKGLERL